MNVLAREMWCGKCDIPLSFKNTESETRRGLACIFTIRCGKCSLIHTVHTFKYNSANRTYEANGKLAFGLLIKISFNLFGNNKC